MLKVTRESAFNLVRDNLAIFVEHCQPSSQIAVAPAMMFQASYSERVGIPIKQEWLAPAKMRDARAANVLRKVPAGAITIVYELFFAVVPPYMLQVGHGALDFAALRH